MKIKILFTALIVGATIACGGGDSVNTEVAMPVWKTHCQLCHGADGKLGLNGAKDLTASTLSLEERIATITNGRNTMIAYESILTPEQIEEVAKYTMTLKQ
ncbi:c-type cytochrome [Portibacter marinus]|uniref:c-type cytochrome n=1 Tax=Portibacter marinus TaxID=2898660 RepID=UPI001F3C785C|nr:c-type cytochrome [Portibacter marinus]